jgi:hypothetical protein
LEDSKKAVLLLLLSEFHQSCLGGCQEREKSVYVNVRNLILNPIIVAHLNDFVIRESRAIASQTLPKKLNIGLVLIHAIRIVFTTNIANLKAIIMTTIFEANDVKMAAITLRNIPNEVHRRIKRIQLDLEDQGVKKTLEEIYLELIVEALKTNPSPVDQYLHSEVKKNDRND